MLINGFKIKVFALAIFTALLGFGVPNFASADFNINVMGPLIVGDIHSPKDSPEAWNQFAADLHRIKALGAEAISTDIWWGAVETSEGHYNWEYYDKLVLYLERAELNWIPILSLHQLGGNVGDKGYIPPPAYIWEKYIGQGQIKDQNSLKYKSEQGHFNHEYVSPWATPYVLSDYRRFFEAFQNRYASKAEMIKEINLSLGPSGELRYPSYNSHDMGSGYPHRGTLQAYSDLAVASFQTYVREKYRSLEILNLAWRSSLTSFEQISPPLENIDEFYLNQIQFTKYGKDFFDWYNTSLTQHGEILLQTAIDVFNSQNAAFKSVAMGAKIPGVHWRISHDRLAELNAGLIRSSYKNWQSLESGFGYLHTLKMFQKVQQANPTVSIVVHFTALEMNNGHDGPEVGSEAKTLVYWMSRLAKMLKLELKGENALAAELKKPQAWYNIKEALGFFGYSGITLLRLESLLEQPEAVKGFKDLVRYKASEKCRKLLP